MHHRNGRPPRISSIATDRLKCSVCVIHDLFVWFHALEPWSQPKCLHNPHNPIHVMSPYLGFIGLCYVWVRVRVMISPLAIITINEVNDSASADDFSSHEPMYRR